MIGKWFKTDMYKGWGITMNQVIVIVFFAVYSSYFYCGLVAIAFDYTSGDNESNGKKRRYAIPSRQKSPSYDSVSDFSQNFRTISKINPHLSGGYLGCGSRSGNTNDQSTHTGTSFLIKRSEGVLEMLDEHKNWSPEKAQLTKDLIQAFANLFTTSNLQLGSSS